MGVFKGTQKILVVTDNSDAASVWSLDFYDQWLSDCSIYLYFILIGNLMDERETYARGYIRGVSILS